MYAARLRPHSPALLHDLLAERAGRPCAGQLALRRTSQPPRPDRSAVGPIRVLARPPRCFFFSSRAPSGLAPYVSARSRDRRRPPRDGVTEPPPPRLGRPVRPRPARPPTHRHRRGQPRRCRHRSSPRALTPAREFGHRKRVHPKIAKARTYALRRQAEC